MNAGGTLSFFADDGAGEEAIWMSDGSEAGTGQVAYSRPGPNSSEPHYLTAVGGTLYFSMNDGKHA
jgi:ELWxxDGT repeat protein